MLIALPVTLTVSVNPPISNFTSSECFEQPEPGRLDALYVLNPLASIEIV